MLASDTLAAEVTCASAGPDDPLMLRWLRRANTNDARTDDNRRKAGFTESLPSVRAGLHAVAAADTLRMMELLRCATGIAVQTPSGHLLPLAHLLGIGRNYAEHAKEQGAAVPDAPMVFTKNAASATLHGQPIVVPKACQDREQVDFEGELAVVIGRAARDVSKSDALSVVLGYACANDVSARWWQKSGSGGQFFRGKSFDTFCPIGPRIVPAAEVADPGKLRLTTRVNGVTKQDSSTGDMIFDVPTLISDLSRGMTLLPGTVILTGTPSGVGMARNPPEWLKHGDVVEVEIEGLGVLRNPVVFEGR